MGQNLPDRYQLLFLISEFQLKNSPGRSFNIFTAAQCNCAGFDGYRAAGICGGESGRKCWYFEQLVGDCRE